MVNAKKHKELLNDTDTRIKKLKTNCINKLKTQKKRRSFLYSHIGNQCCIESKIIDDKRAKIVKEYKESLVWI